MPQSELDEIIERNNELKKIVEEVRNACLIKHAVPLIEILEQKKVPQDVAIHNVLDGLFGSEIKQPATIAGLKTELQRRQSWQAGHRLYPDIELS